MPLEATHHTPEGARAFAEFFIKTIDWGYATTSSTYMRHYFTKSCIGCRSTADALDRARRQQHHFIGDRFTVRAVDNRGQSNGDTRLLLLTFDVDSVEVVDKNNKYVDGGQALTNFQELAELSWRSAHWMVEGLTVKL